MGILNYARAAGYAGTSALLKSTSMQRMTLAGGLAGAAYGGTLGRDRGQSMLGGAMWGAAGGALLGRYGSAALRGGRRTMGAYSRLGSGLTQGSASMGRRAQAMGMGAGRGAFRQAARDARWAGGHIGRTLTKGYGKIKGLAG